MDAARSFRWWATALLPVVALSACGGSRLTHDAIVTAVNGGGSLPAAQAVQQQQQQQPQQGGLSTVPGNGATALGGDAPATGGVSGAGAGSAPAGHGASGSGTGTRTVPGAGASAGVAAAGSGPEAARPAGPLAPIVLGNVGNYSGPAGSSTSAAPTAIRVWAQWTNAHGGIAGHPVQVFTADDGSDPARSRSLIQDMVENKHVIAFVGNMVPQDADAGVTYLEQKHIPVVGGDAIMAPWTSSPVFFPMGTTWLSLIESTLKAAHDAGATRLAVLYCIETPACDQINKHINDTAARYGEQIVYTSRVTVTQPDYTAQCLGAEQNGAQAVWLGVDAGSHERVANSCKRQNYHPLYLMPNQTSTTTEAQDGALDGTIASAPVFPWMVTGGNAEIDAYNRAMQQFAPDLQGSGSTAIQWASGELFRIAAAGIGAMPTSDAIFKGLWALRNETVGGLTPPLTFAANQPSPPVTCYFITKISGGRWTAPNGARSQCL
jgi:branched-chain amino acid transport system substrate-binding protein